MEWEVYYFMKERYFTFFLKFSKDSAPSGSSLHLLCFNFTDTKLVDYLLLYNFFVFK